MKKTVTAAAVAALLAITLSSCGGRDKTEEGTHSESVVTTAADTVSDSMID